jgi:hypothetical protein
MIDNIEPDKNTRGDENKDDGAGYPIKILLKEALV